MLMIHFLLVSVLASFASPDAEGGSSLAARRLEDALRAEKSVEFYFVARTGDYVLRGEDFKAASTIVINRRCGANCHVFMREVISHLRDSMEVACQRGQETTMIETGNGLVIIYSQSGRSIEFEERCYFNESGVHLIVKSSDFLFN